MDLKLYLHKCHDPEGRENTCILSLRDHTNKCELDVWVAMGISGIDEALLSINNLLTCRHAVRELARELAHAPWENYPPEWR
jgi:hypothetical protein